MNIKDKKYLEIQFDLKILEGKGIEFQSLVENILEKTFDDFQKINPIGRSGDGGNDGYIKKEGKFYQAYGPEKGKNNKKIVQKMKEDFFKIKKVWKPITKVKEYSFVFNDRNKGSNIVIEKGMQELEDKNKGIIFKLFCSKDLKKLFFNLSDSDIQSLGFDIDSQKTLSNAYKYLEILEIEIDKDNIGNIDTMLDSLDETFKEISNEELDIKHRYLKCRCKSKMENLDDAIDCYWKIVEDFPRESNALLYLAEISLRKENYKENKKLITKAEKINPDYWFLKIEKLIRMISLREVVNIDEIVEENLPEEPRFKSICYRVYAIIFMINKKHYLAEAYINKAIANNRDRIDNYIEKLDILFAKAVNLNKNISSYESKEILDEIDKIENRFNHITSRNKVVLAFMKIHIYHYQKNQKMFEKTGRGIFNLIFMCYFDSHIDTILSELLRKLIIDNNHLQLVTDYLLSSNKQDSNILARSLVKQFIIHNSLFDDGKKYFEKRKNNQIEIFINNLKSNNLEKIINFINEEHDFESLIIKYLNGYSDLKREILRTSTINEDNKKILMIYIDQEEGDYDKAFSQIKKIDLNKLHIEDCREIYKTLKMKKAWDYQKIILERILNYYNDVPSMEKWKLELMDVNAKLNRYSEVIDMGEELLKNVSKSIFNENNYEYILGNTLIAYLEKGKICKDYYEKAESLLNNYKSINVSYDFKIGIAAEVLLKNNEPQKSFDLIVNAIKEKKVLSSSDYSKLYSLVSLRISANFSISLDSLKKIESDMFVKLKNIDCWYYIGEYNELDANKIPKSNKQYNEFSGKALNEKIIFKHEFCNDNEEIAIEKIYKIEQYIVFKIISSFNRLVKNKTINNVRMISVVNKNGDFDIKNLELFMKKSSKNRDEFFEKYYKENNLPLAFLALREGGLVNAISRIRYENRGFINFCLGNEKEYEKQRNIAKHVINQKTSFYIDGTSMFFLVESGLLGKIFKYLPKMKIPQSVLNMLNQLVDELEVKEGERGRLAYLEGRIIYTPIDESVNSKLYEYFAQAINLIEKKSNNIKFISDASKSDNYSEKKMYPELADAYILAQKENIPIMTEDYFYCLFASSEKMESLPDNFSSYYLIKILYEQNEISFEEYLEYFSYLSRCRFRFLSVNMIDIKKTIFGDKKILDVKPENMQKLNLNLLLSQEYGVDFNMALSIIMELSLHIISDKCINQELLQLIFIEIINAFPGMKNRRDTGELILSLCKSGLDYINRNGVLEINNEESLQRLKDLKYFVNDYYKLISK